MRDVINNNMTPMLLMTEEQKLALIELTEEEQVFVKEKAYRFEKDLELIETQYRKGVREWLVIKNSTDLAREEYASAVVNRKMAEQIKDPVRPFNTWRSLAK